MAKQVNHLVDPIRDLIGAGFARFEAKDMARIAECVGGLVAMCSRIRRCTIDPERGRGHECGRRIEAAELIHSGKVKSEPGRGQSNGDREGP